MGDDLACYTKNIANFDQAEKRQTLPFAVRERIDFMMLAGHDRPKHMIIIVSQITGKSIIHLEPQLYHNS